jgi:hypothetical protein
MTPLRLMRLERVSKAWKITTVDFRVSQVLEFNNFRANITLF